MPMISIEPLALAAKCVNPHYKRRRERQRLAHPQPRKYMRAHKGLYYVSTTLYPPTGNATQRVTSPTDL